MIPRVKSLSKCGLVIERLLGKDQQKTDQNQLRKLLQKKMKSIPHKKAHKKEGLNAIVGRQIQSTYQRCVTNETSVVTYQNKKHLLFSKPPLYPVRQQKRQRLDVFNKEQWERGSICKRHRSAEAKPKHSIMTTRDLETHRNIFHTLDFAKQSLRPFDVQIQELKKRNKKIEFYTPPGSLVRTQSVHAFESYTKRSFLQNCYRPGETLGAEVQKINPEKFKGSWKIVGSSSFSKSTDKHLSRYDRDCAPWNPKLNYNPKDQRRVSSVAFGTLTARKDNLVKSSYPLRIAM